MVTKKWVLISVIVSIGIGLAILEFEHGKSLAPQLQQTVSNFNKTSYSIVEFQLPDDKAQPLFPIYDKARNAIWVGDIKPNSSRIWEFDLDSKKFVEHHLDGTDIITISFLDSDGSIWYIDPTTKFLGHYDSSGNTNKLTKVPSNGTPSGLIVDLTGGVWITVSNLDQIIKYDVQRDNFTIILPSTPHASPLTMDIDKKSGYIWIVEAIGKIARLDPSSYKITEYEPSGYYKLKLPVAIKSDPSSGTVYIAEHGEDAIFAFYSLNDTFKRLQLHPDAEALPFGMSFDKQGNLWIAQHTVNKVAVIDPRTDESREVEIPSANPLAQWITSDSQGNIWIAEPGSAALAVVNQTS